MTAFEPGAGYDNRPALTGPVGEWDRQKLLLLPVREFLSAGPGKKAGRDIPQIPKDIAQETART